MRENEGVLLNQLVKADRAKKTVFLQPPAFQAGCHGLATGALAPRILLCRENQVTGASFAFPIASQPFPRCLSDGSRLGSTRPAQVRPCHLLLKNPLLVRADVPEDEGSLA